MFLVRISPEGGFLGFPRTTALHHCASYDLYCYCSLLYNVHSGYRYDGQEAARLKVPDPRVRPAEPRLTLGQKVET